MNESSLRNETPSKIVPSDAASLLHRVRTICVYCGSSTGTDPLYDSAARQFGRILAQAGVGLIYGGTTRGLMGKVAAAVMEAGGSVTGVIPHFLTTLTEPFEQAQRQIIVPDMHSRKRVMFEEADAFVALPGGVGTLDELIEQLSWLQLRQHTKPVVIADIGGFWRPLLALFAHMREQGFIQPALEVPYLVAEKIEDVLPMIEAALAKTQARGAAKEKIDEAL